MGSLGVQVSLLLVGKGDDSPARQASPRVHPSRPARLFIATAQASASTATVVAAAPTMLLQPPNSRTAPISPVMAETTYTNLIRDSRSAMPACSPLFDGDANRGQKDLEVFSRHHLVVVRLGELDVLALGADDVGGLAPAPGSHGQPTADHDDSLLRSASWSQYRHRTPSGQRRDTNQPIASTLAKRCDIAGPRRGRGRVAVLPRGLVAGPLVSGGREPPLYLVERLWRGSVGAGCSPRRVGLYPPVT